MQRENVQVRRVIILTALPVEYQAVRSHLRDLREAVHKGTVYERGVFSTPRGACEVGMAQIGAGNVTAAAEAERAITYFSPSLAFFVGVAGGLKDVSLGDVVVATKVYGYESGKADSTFQPRPEVGLSAYALVQRAKAEARKNGWLQRLGRSIPQQAPCVIVAPIAAGEKVIASTRSVIWKFVKTNYGDAVAIEMEGHGFLQATYVNQQVEALIIRGISDLIDGKREADAANFQEIAARHASAFAFEMLTRLISQQGLDVSQTETARATWDMPPLTSLPPRKNQYLLHNQGSIPGIVQQGSNNNVQTFITHFPSKDEEAEGRAYLQRGRTALLYGDYATAKQHLTEATRLLREDQLPAEGAQVRYLQTLALLNGKRPRSTAYQTFRRIEELMKGVVALLPARSYLYALALIKRDYAWNGYPHFRDEADELIRQAEGISPSSQDQENVDLLFRCQPHLVHDAQSWWG